MVLLRAGLVLFALAGGFIFPREARVETCGYDPATGDLTWSGLQWIAEAGPRQQPAPVIWSRENLWLDEQCRLHLRLERTPEGWRGAEIVSRDSLVFGSYQWQVSGRPDLADANAVLGLFSFPDFSQVGTREIDIELSRFGRADADGLQFQAFHASDPGQPSARVQRRLSARANEVTFRYTRSPGRVQFEAMRGLRDDSRPRAACWTAANTRTNARVSDDPMRVLINLWMYNGTGANETQAIEVVIVGFRHRPAEDPPHCRAPWSR